MNPGNRTSTPIHPHPPRPKTDAETAAQMETVAELVTSVIVAVVDYHRTPTPAHRGDIRQSVVTVLKAFAEADK